MCSNRDETTKYRRDQSLDLCNTEHNKYVDLTHTVQCALSKDMDYRYLAALIPFPKTWIIDTFSILIFSIAHQDLHCSSLRPNSQGVLALGRQGEQLLTDVAHFKELGAFYVYFG
jgi:hypothetical protein